MSKKGKADKENRFVFYLRGIETEIIDHKYSILKVSDILTPQKSVVPTNTTKLADLSAAEKSNEIVSFLDETKRLHKCDVCAIDYDSNRQVQMLRYHCYWDHHPFDTKPIGCPIEFVQKRAEKTYYSEISKDTYTIKEDVNERKLANIDASNTNIHGEEYYVTDGVFCSFNCVRAFIEDRKHIVKYRDSKVLLNRMYNDMIGGKCSVIESAPNWRLLNVYGGPMTINEFRNNFNKVDFEYHGDVKKIPKCASLASLWEKKIKF